MNNLPETNKEMPPPKSMMSMEAGATLGVNNLMIGQPDDYREEPTLKRKCFEENGALDDSSVNFGSSNAKPTHEAFKATSKEFYEGWTSLTQEWYNHLQQTEEEDETAITRMTKLTSASKQLNEGFKQQLDGLHGSVMHIMSSFKR